MATQALYRKWRSQTFDEVIGQHHVTQTLQNAIELNRVAHAYLFTGPRGTGKTSTARILAKAVNCLEGGNQPCNHCVVCIGITDGTLIDLIEIDAASNTSVDDIRDLRDKVDFRPAQARMKFYIIDEVHMLSKSAFNALLKTLEEPPPHVIFVLATTEPEKIPATIMSRCQRFDFRRIKVQDIAAHLRFILDQEEIKAEDEALTVIARQGGGSMRDSISLLDQLTSYASEAITLDLVRSVLGTANTTATQTLVDYLLQGDIGAGLTLLNEVINDGVEPRQFTLELLEYLRGLLLVKYDNGPQFLNLPSEMIEKMADQASTVPAARLLKLTERFNNAVKDYKVGGGEVAIPQLPLELAIVDAITNTSATEITASQATSPSMVPSVSAVSRAKAPEGVANDLAPESTVSKQSTAASTADNDDVEQAETTDLTIEALRAKWPELLEEVTRRGGTKAYLTKPIVADVQVEQNSIVVLIAPEYKDAARRANKSKETINQAFQAVLGAAWMVKLEVAAETPSSTLLTEAPPSLPTEDTVVSEKKNLETPSEDELLEDELIRTAIEDLKGTYKGTRSLDSE